jgi:hypothetical protein
MRDNMSITRKRFAEKRAEEEAKLPFFKRWYKKTLRWINSSEKAVITAAMCIIWPLALAPVLLFWFLWNLLGPATFWQMFAMFIFIGGPLAIPQLFLLAIALALTFGLIAEIIDK